MKTAVQQIIEKFEHIQKNDCKTLPEVVFFDGVIAIIESEFLEKERHQIFEAVKYGFNDANKPFLDRDVSFANYYNETFTNH